MQYTPPSQDILKVLAVATREELVFLYCYVLTGARRSEIFRWTWNDDINFQYRKYRLGTRKTRDGSMQYEWFPMQDLLYDELMWWFKNRPIKNTPYVFVSTQAGATYGKPYKVRRKFLRGLCKRARVKAFGFYALRRYFASILADEYKESPKTIQRLLRHSNLYTTERYIQNLNRDLKSTLELVADSVSKIHMDHTHKEKKVSPDNG